MLKYITLKFFIFYLFLSSLIIYIIVIDYNNSINTYLKSQTQSNYLKLQSIYNRHKEIANIIFDTDINTKEVLNIFKDAHNAKEPYKNVVRVRLLEKLTEQYNKLKKYNLKQLHFHLPNNESFLRMHRPKKFGDNLTNIRNTVMYVNKNKEYLHGFEEGRIFNGFRYVYPLFWKNEHIGSVEVSFSALALIESFHKTFNLNSSFLIKKSVVDEKVFEDEKNNYIISPSKDFYYEKSVYEKFPPINKNPYTKDNSELILKGEPFSYFMNEVIMLKTVVPIKNPVTNEVVAVFCICEKDTFIPNAKKNFSIMVLFTLITLFVILYLIYRQKANNEYLKKLNKDLDRKVSLQVKENKRKDIHIQNQNKVAAIGEMLSNIAHQWRQPLNVISTSASGLMVHREFDTLDDKTFNLLTDSIVDQTQYLSDVIENFKNHFDSKNSNKITKLYFQEMLKSSLDILNSTLQYNHIRITTDFEEEELFINASHNQVTQILLSLVNNAKDALIKNNDIENRIITITLKRKKEHLFLTIQDNGGGIQKDIINKIFDPYFTTKHQSIGTGINLFMTHEIISKELKGNIYVKNKNKGAKFFIEIPLYSEPIK